MRIEQRYVASDGETCMLSVDVVLAGEDQSVERHRAEAQRYFDRFGYRVVEDAKAKGCWPLSADHPNHPDNA